MEQAADVCRDLGRELANAGWDLLAFSEDEDYVEHWTVEGYRSAAAASRGTVRVRQPLDHPVTWVTEPGGPRIVREPVPAAVGWEIPFYGAVLEVDAVLLVGGARATRTAGVIALNRGIPVLPVPLFGGAAEQIWEELTKVGNDTDRGLRSTMAGASLPGIGKSLVAVLDEQRRRYTRRVREEGRVAREPERHLAVRHLAGLTLVTVAVAAGALYYGWALAGVVAIAMVAAAGSALVSHRSAVRGGPRRRRDAAEPSLTITSTRGAFAGLVTVLTYVVSQTLASGPNDELANGSITAFAVVAGAISGFTADRVLAQIRPIDAGDPSRLAQLGPDAAPVGAEPRTN